MKCFLATTAAMFLMAAPFSLAQIPAAPDVPPAAAEAIARKDAAAATRAWLDSVPAEKRAKSDAYFEGGYWLLLWDFLLTAAISIVLLLSGVSARLRDWAEGRTRSRSLQVALYAFPYIIIVAAVGFPLHVYVNFLREHAYGLATQNFSAWFGEQLVALIVQLVTTTVLLIGLYAVFRRASQTWWIWGTLTAIVFLMITMMLAPVYIAPLFNKYKPLDNPAISESILSLARANQIPVKQVFEVDASRQTTRISANVSGFLGTTRISLNDNLLKQCSLAEIRHVMGHEMGHYVLNHGAKLVIAFGLFFLVAFAAARWAFGTALRRWGERWRVRGIADPAGLPLLALVFSAVFFVLTPVRNSVVRISEIEADAFGLNAAREPEGFAAVSLKLGAYRKLDPGELEEMIFFDHPSGRARIRMAMDWRAENPAETSR